MCMADLEDLAEAASIILTSPGHTGATYELCGPENLSLSDMKAAMEQHFGREIKVETPKDEMFASQLKKLGVGDYQVNTLLKMFQHYNEHGFVGNPNVLTRSERLSIGFEVKSLDEAMELFKNKNIPIKRGPISPLPSYRFFFIDDPNGIEIQIVQDN